MSQASAELHFGPGTVASPPISKTIDALRPVLLDPNLPADPDAPVYTLYQDLASEEVADEIQRRGLTYRAVVLRAGKLGEERTRTRGHTSSLAPGTTIPFPEVYEVWHGRALVYAQSEAAADVSDVVALELAPGNKAIQPPGWASLIANIGEEPLVLGAWCARERLPIYDALAALGGMAHFILDNQGAPPYRFQPNTRYRTVPVPRVVPAPDYPDFGLHKSEPMLTTFRRNPDFFRFLTRPQDYDHVWTALHP